jgi:hypothetical protein
VHRLLNPRVPLRSSRRGLRRSAFGLSIGPPNLRQSTDLASAPGRVFFPGEPPPWILTLVLYFFSPPCAALSLPTGPLRVPALPLPRGAAAATGRGGELLGHGSPRRRRRRRSPCAHVPAPPARAAQQRSRGPGPHGGDRVLPCAALCSFPMAIEFPA